METIKKEKKADLEQLLNSLIERGWLPFGEGCHRSPYKRVSIHKNYNKERTYVLFYSNNHSHWKVLRQVVSKESGLWQFVCENRMVEHRNYWVDTEIGRDEQYKYRLIETSLKNEDELENFLLSNIKVEGIS